MQTRIGLYPGTFDPPHAGHLALARGALEACRLDEVVFLPEARPRGKRGVTRLDQRLRWLRELAAGDARLSVQQLDDAQFSVTSTWPALQRAVGVAQVTLLVGSDVAGRLGTWPKVADLLGQVDLAVGIREPDSVGDVLAQINSLRQDLGIAFEATFILTDQAGMASSQLRARQQH